ncbi:MAG TPA: hypothetical protein VF179_05370 [Thermoanaerobaculia bacterium]|nr:hypothetical protein [Thermoanaerobaculia bacterium]
MANSCADLDRRLREERASRTSLDPDWENHFAACESCCAQWAAHQLLREALSQPSVPELGLRFTPALMARLERQEETAASRALSPQASWALRLYWAMTVLLSAGIVAGIDWRGAFTATPWLLALLLVPLLASPLLLLSFRANDFLNSTFSSEDLR